MSSQRRHISILEKIIHTSAHYGLALWWVVLLCVVTTLYITQEANVAIASQETATTSREVGVVPHLQNTITVQELVDMANKSRVDAGLPKLTWNHTLAISAQLKATDMASKGYFAHNTPEGKKPWYWFDEAGYDYRSAGENLAVNFITSSDIEYAWMNSSSHRKNILDPEFSEIGISFETGYYKGRLAIFVVEHFGSPRTSIFQF